MPFRWYRSKRSVAFLTNSECNGSPGRGEYAADNSLPTSPSKSSCCEFRIFTVSYFPRNSARTLFVARISKLSSKKSLTAEPYLHPRVSPSYRCNTTTNVPQQYNPPCEFTFAQNRSPRAAAKLMGIKKPTQAHPAKLR